MSQGAQDFTPAEILAAGQDAEARGHHDYAEQFYRHLTDYYPAHPEAAQALAAIGRLRQRETRRGEAPRAATGRGAGEASGHDIAAARPPPPGVGQRDGPNGAHSAAQPSARTPRGPEHDHFSLSAAMAAGLGPEAEGTGDETPGPRAADANTTRPTTRPPAPRQSHPAPPHVNGRQDGAARPPAAPNVAPRPAEPRPTEPRAHEPRVRIAPAEPVRRGLQRAPALPRVRKRFLFGRIAAMALIGLGACLLLIALGNLAVAILVPEISGTLTRAAGGAAFGLTPLAFATAGLVMSLVVGGFLITVGQLMSAGFATANATAELVALQKAVMRRQLDLVDDDDAAA